MLINFSVKNFLSIKEKVSFSMEATKYKSDFLSENNVKISTIDLLKSAVIFGANASGKSNLILAMNAMRLMVEDTHEFKKNTILPFGFDTNFLKKPTTFEIKFLHEEIIYRYGFSIKDGVVQKEWLKYKKNIEKSRESEYFKRSFQKFENFGDFKNEADLIKKRNITREDKLYINVVSEFNGTIAKKVTEWFGKFNAFSSLHSHLTNITYRKMKDEKQKQRIVELMQSADFGIADLQMKTNLGENGVEDYLVNSYHHIYEDKKFVGTKSIPLLDESDGTKKLFGLAGAIIEVLDNGEILVVDELSNSLHTKMIESIVKLFNSEKNTKNAQLIFTSHDTNILTQKLFRRDQIWFTQKNIYGETDLYSLIDFGERKDALVEKKYLEGAYGSIPMVTELEYSNG